MKLFKLFFFLSLLIICSGILSAKSYNTHGQTGLINLPSAEIHQEQSIFFTFNKSTYAKLGTITATPFDWMEASFFYYRPDDLLWGSAKGLYLDKGFNVKFSYKPKSIILPRFAIGLDDFAGTGQFTKEYIASTYDFKNYKFTSGIGWGKFVGESNNIKNPFGFLNEAFNDRAKSSDNFKLGGNPSYDLWFRGDAVLFGGIEAKLNRFKNISLKVESNPFDYYRYGCCGEGLSAESFEVRNKKSDINFGISFKYKNFGNIDFSYVKGDTWNIIFSIGFSSNKNLRKKNKFNPIIENRNYNQDKKNEFYLDLLENLNRNKLYLQSASIEKDSLSITIDSLEHYNPIIYSSRSAYIAKKVSDLNNYDFKRIEIGHLTRGTKINSLSYKSSDLNLEQRYPNILVKRNSIVSDPSKVEYLNDEFRPKVRFPIFMYSFSPDIRTHIGSPQRFMYAGFGIKLASEIQINRNIVIHSTFGKSFKDNFDKKRSTPNSSLDTVRTEIVDYLQKSSDDIYISNLDIESIWSPLNNVWAKLNFGFLESMYGGLSSELIYKPFNLDIVFGVEYNKVKKRSYDQKFSFLEYEVDTAHFNLAYYEARTNILVKWSYGKYLAKDKGYTLDLSRKMPSGWNAGFFFSRTNVSAEQFGEGSFDKGFYFNIPFNIFSKGYTKDSNGFKTRTMTRDGGQKLELKNRLVDSFYGSTLSEINENWNEYLD